jgi:hypothetical protein
MTEHWHVGYDNHSGPSSEQCVQSAAEALRAWHGGLTIALARLNDDAEFVGLDTRRHAVTEDELASKGRISMDVGSETHYAIRRHDDWAECPEFRSLRNW